jgi:chromosome segregation ATPase
LDLLCQDELTLMKQEKAKVEDELRISKELHLLADIYATVLVNEVEKLNGSLDRLKEERNYLEDLLEHQEERIAKVETLEEEVERLDAMNKELLKR